MKRKLAIIGTMAAIMGMTGCEPVDEVVVFDEPTHELLEGRWSGMTEITSADDIGTDRSNNGRGFVFPVVLDLRKGGRFTLVTSNYPASYTDDASRTCQGTWQRSGQTLELFSFEACRALPVARYTMGRTLPDGLTLEASTRSAPTYTPANIRVSIRLERL